MISKQRIAWLSISVIIGLIGCVKENPSSLFREIPPSQSGIDFENFIKESDSLNMLEYANFYTGAGVAVGDFNNDGLDDVFFGGNMVSSKLYLNKGDLKFEDITQQAGLITKRWINGVTLSDVNQDGWLDIYLCVSGKPSPTETRNLLYINNKDLTFSERGAEYGIDDPGATTHAAFLDYDRDGDLDLFLAQNGLDISSKVNYVFFVRPEPNGQSTDKLFKNNGNNTFTDVSTEAGIVYGGFSLGLVVGDINGDDLDDIFISNDFQGNDLLYMNNGNGTFSEQARNYLRHSSFSGMGVDMSDVNRDGSPDLLVLDMLAEGNARQKLLMEWPSYEKYTMSLGLGYLPQFTRNTLQLSNGKDFSEVGQLAGIESTDWSWAPLFGDFDNDQDQDIFITNGFVRDLGDMDFVNYRNQEENVMSAPIGKAEVLKRISEMEGVPLLNYLYENNGNCQFKKQSEEWGIDKTTFSYGATVSDLDNDGDVDLLANNSNDVAQVFENRQNKLSRNHFLKIKLEGKLPNLQGLGAKIWLDSKSGTQYYQHFPYRGYLGTVSQVVHFGLGKDSVVDRIRIRWPDGTEEILFSKAVDQTLTVSQINASNPTNSIAKKESTWFEKLDQSSGLVFQHLERAWNDFVEQPLLPHLNSRYSPGIAVGDVNADGMDDVFVGGDPGQQGILFIQQKTKNFKGVQQNHNPSYEDMGSLFFDADLDGDLDLVVSSGGTMKPKGSTVYSDRLYFNNGKGDFSDEVILPGVSSSSSVVSGCDFDKDGDIDLFIGGRVLPGEYPLAPKSKLLKNLSIEKSKGQFQDISYAVEGLEYVGMITSALWSDVDNDSWIDLMMVGEWMPLTIFKNNNGILKKWETPTLAHSSGWWNSLAGADFDLDGDIDYVAGNLGLNSRFVCSTSEPITIYAKDFDNNGEIDPVLCMFINGEQHAPYFRGQLLAQLPVLKKEFDSFKKYSEAGFFDLFSKQKLEGALTLQSETFVSSYFENEGGGNFLIRQLPTQVQVSPTFGVLVNDINEDGNPDIMLVGNSYSNDAFVGQDDAGIGACLLGDGKGNFKFIGPEQSGFRADKDAKAFGSLLVGSEELVLVSNNNGPLETHVFHPKASYQFIKLLPMDAYCIVMRKDGVRYKQEFYYGSSYLSQSSRYFKYDDSMKEISIVQYNGATRRVNPAN
jgi:enediyne biosynthesis protein E4